MGGRTISIKNNKKIIAIGIIGIVVCLVILGVYNDNILSLLNLEKTDKSFLLGIWQGQVSITLISIGLVTITVSILEERILGEKFINILNGKIYKFFNYWDWNIVTFILSVVNLALVYFNLFVSVIFIFTINIIIVIFLIKETFNIITNKEAGYKIAGDYIIKRVQEADFDNSLSHDLKIKIRSKQSILKEIDFLFDNKRDLEFYKCRYVIEVIEILVFEGLEHNPNILQYILRYIEKEDNIEKNNVILSIIIECITDKIFLENIQLTPQKSNIFLELYYGFYRYMGERNINKEILGKIKQVNLKCMENFIIEKRYDLVQELMKKSLNIEINSEKTFCKMEEILKEVNDQKLTGNKLGGNDFIKNKLLFEDLLLEFSKVYSKIEDQEEIIERISDNSRGNTIRSISNKIIFSFVDTLEIENEEDFKKAKSYLNLFARFKEKCYIRLLNNKLLKESEKYLLYLTIFGDMTFITKQKKNDNEKIEKFDINDYIDWTTIGLLCDEWFRVENKGELKAKLRLLIKEYKGEILKNAEYSFLKNILEYKIYKVLTFYILWLLKLGEEEIRNKGDLKTKFSEYTKLKDDEIISFYYYFFNENLNFKKWLKENIWENEFSEALSSEKILVYLSCIKSVSKKDFEMLDKEILRNIINKYDEIEKKMLMLESILESQYVDKSYRITNELSLDEIRIICGRILRKHFFETIEENYKKDFYAKKVYENEVKAKTILYNSLEKQIDEWKNEYEYVSSIKEKDDIEVINDIYISLENVSLRPYRPLDITDNFSIVRENNNTREISKKLIEFIVNKIKKRYLNECVNTISERNDLFFNSEKLKKKYQAGNIKYFNFIRNSFLGYSIYFEDKELETLPAFRFSKKDIQIRIGLKELKVENLEESDVEKILATKFLEDSNLEIIGLMGYNFEMRKEEVKKLVEKTFFKVSISFAFNLEIVANSDSDTLKESQDI